MILKVDPVPIYWFYSYKKAMKEALFQEDEKVVKQLKKEFKEKNFKKLLNTRWITFYLYQKLEEGKWRELKALSVIFRQDFLRAIYLYVVISNV